MKLATLTNPNFFSALNKLLTCDMPMKTAFKLNKEAIFLEEENKRYNSMRSKIINDFGDKNEDGTIKVVGDRVVFSENKEAEAVARINELLLIEIEAGKYSVEDFGNATISPTDLFALGELIKE